MDVLALGVGLFVLLPLAVGCLVRSPASYWLWLGLTALAVVSQAAVDTMFVVPVLLVATASFLFVVLGARLRRRLAH